MNKDRRLYIDSTARNAASILAVLKPLFGEGPRDVLEVASGSGEHAVHITSACPNLTWWPTDLDPTRIRSIDAWRAATENPALQPARILDVTETSWREGGSIDGWPAKFDAIININMIHISPWSAARGLIEGAGARLRTGGFLYFYGAFKRGGNHTAPTNEEFDQSLRSRDPSWGIRDIDDVEKLAGKYGFTLECVAEMPANNLSLIFRKQ